MAWRKYVSLAELYGFYGGIYVQVCKPAACQHATML